MTCIGPTTQKRSALSVFNCGPLLTGFSKGFSKPADYETHVGFSYQAGPLSVMVMGCTVA